MRERPGRVVGAGVRVPAVRQRHAERQVLVAERVEDLGRLRIELEQPARDARAPRGGYRSRRRRSRSSRAKSIVKLASDAEFASLLPAARSCSPKCASRGRAAKVSLIACGVLRRLDVLLQRRELHQRLQVRRDEAGKLERAEREEAIRPAAARGPSAGSCRGRRSTSRVIEKLSSENDAFSFGASTEIPSTRIVPTRQAANIAVTASSARSFFTSCGTDGSMSRSHMSRERLFRLAAVDILDRDLVEAETSRRRRRCPSSRRRRRAKRAAARCCRRARRDMRGRRGCGPTRRCPCAPPRSSRSRSSKSAPSGA